jgi:hypothetical protein
VINWLKMRVGEFRWIKWTVTAQLAAAILAALLFSFIVHPIKVSKIFLEALIAPDSGN